MFIRKTKKPNGNKEYYTYQLVESYRTERGPRQRILLSMGSGLKLEKEQLRVLANRIEEIETGSMSLFPLPEKLESLAQKFAGNLREKALSKPAVQRKEGEYQSVDLASLKHQDSRSIGVETLAYRTVQKLGLESKLLELGLTQRQVEISIALIVHRLVDPGSELYAYYWLKETTALGELMRAPFQQLSKNSIYKVGGLLLSHREALEKYLESQQKTLFNSNNTIYLYDLTNTYFEGRPSSEKAKRGVSKERRLDAPLVTLGLVVNQDGFAKRSRIFEGNISEPKTLKLVLKDLQADARNPILCLDAGIATKENLNWLREHKIRYLTIEKHRRAIELDEETTTFQDKTGQTIRAKLISTPDGVELHCQSEARRKKEQAIQEKLRSQLENALAHADQSIRKIRGIKRYEKVLERVGRLKEKFRGISSYYQISVVRNPQKPDLARSIEWEFRADKAKKKFNGGYLLKGWGVDLSPEELWRTYITLTQVESAFRALKTDLGLRPIYHQKEERIDAHLFITILAYHVLQAIRFTLRNKGLSMSWQTIRRIFQTQVRVTTTMKTPSDQLVHIRSTVLSTLQQSQIYRALGIAPSADWLVYNF